MTQARPRAGLVARADNGGLGVQTFDWYRHMNPDKVLVVDVEHLTGYKNYFERYPKAVVAKGFEISEAAIDTFLEGLDVVFTVECPYNHYLYQKAREMGVKTVCQYNWEWLAQLAEPNLPWPDVLLAPSMWHFADMNAKVNNLNLHGLNLRHEYMHVPIDRELFPYKKRTTAHKFLHIAGHNFQGAEDRNGTVILLESLPYIQSDIEIVIRSQGTLPRPYTDHKVTIEVGDVKEPKDLYGDEDILILPRRYGGLSLQLNEAMSSGMVPLMLDIEPNRVLDKKLLIPATTSGQLMIKAPITVYGCSPQELANKIDEIANTDISELSEKSNEYAKERDWEVMKPQYEELLCSLL